MFSVKPFLKRVVPQPLRRLITPIGFWREGPQTQTSPGVFAQAFFEKACGQAVI